MTATSHWEPSAALRSITATAGDVAAGTRRGGWRPGQLPAPASVSSTRRFCARPCGVSFEATGSASPKPCADTMLGLTPIGANPLSTCLVPLHIFIIDGKAT